MKGPSLNEQLTQIFLNDPDLLYSAAYRDLQYINQLEQHLIQKGDIDGLTEMAKTGLSKLPQKIQSLNKILPNIQTGGKEVRIEALELYAALDYAVKHLERQFPDFKPKYKSLTSQ